MSIPFEDPVAKEPDDTQQCLSDSALDRFTSVNDTNENVVQSKSRHEQILEPEKIFDFIVCNHESNKEQASRINEEMEKLGLRGYIHERDMIAGQYKLTADEQTIPSTKKKILLISTEALTCDDFKCKMHAPSNFNVIPIYIGIPKEKYPRLLRHHFGIQYTNDANFWYQIHKAITKRPMNDSESSTEVGNRSKPFKKDPSSQASPLPRKSKKAIKDSSPSSKQKPEKKWWPFRLKQNGEKEIPLSIPMQTIRTKGKALDDEASNR